ncbi:MAG TPA: MaoC/PaaZ C-terminal domain-containing protein [Rhizomicrobium sp.]|nr:MaoC/PaaZ C-terminal domain-containing protein [Rhizomicrobium sp.]
MAINFGQIMELKSAGEMHRYTDRDAMLYALGIGFGRDPLDVRELRYVYENDLQTVPTFATVIGFGQPTLAHSGINWLMVVHGEQRLTLHKPLPCEAEVICDEAVVGAIDKGTGRGALILLEKVIRDKATGQKLCTLGATIFARGDGGFGGPREGAPEPHPLPGRTPDLAVESGTRPDQALLYALSGDRNPLHRDPNVARLAGFERPILHGLCTYGIACRAVISGVCDYDATKIAGFDARFSAPVFPGETILTEMWVDGAAVSFRCKAKERDVVVLSNGKCTLRD